ncbi:MAG: ATP-binding cassette domain-containing protein [bacterium]|nr:ATP-binding cassette domain-containing protein [bacterium]
MARGTHVAASGLHKLFGTLRVLRGVNLEIAPGEFVGVVGRSGSGKSTLLRLIAGLDAPDAGDIRIDDALLVGQNKAARVMFQDARLLPWKTALENVRIGLPRERTRDAAEALDQVGLKAHANAWVSVMSGGERQRVALARALVSRPPLLLLDEPLGALDALTRIDMQMLVERLWLEQRFSALLITHDVEEAVALADRVVLIEDGVIGLAVTVDLPRPRDRGSAAFAALKSEILNRVMGFHMDTVTSL